MPAKTVPALIGRTVRCLLFDFGDTLWTRGDLLTWTRLEQKANLQAVALLRSRMTPDDLPTLDDDTLGGEVRRAVERQIRDGKRQNPEYEPDFALTSLHGLQQLGIAGADRRLGHDIYEALRIPILPSRTIFPDVFPTLAALRARGFLLGVVTNRHWGGEPFVEDLGAMGFLDYFPLAAIAISADLGVCKPNPTIFLHPLNALGVAPEEAAMVGDSLSADIAGARGMNIFAIWKPKPYLYAEAKALRRAAHSEHPPLDVGRSEDDFVLDYARSRESKRKLHLQHEMKPDLIIEHMSDLLNVFVQSGRQG